MTTPLKNEGLDVYVRCYGIKKRCQKPSVETINLGEVALDADKDMLCKTALPMITELMKTCEKATIHFNYVTYSILDGITFKELKIGDNRHEIRTLL